MIQQIEKWIFFNMAVLEKMIKLVFNWSVILLCQFWFVILLCQYLPWVSYTNYYILLLDVFLQNSSPVDSVLFGVSALGVSSNAEKYTQKKSAITKAEVIGLGPNSRLLMQYKESLVELSPTQREAAIGLMLGDVSLQTQNGGKTFRMKFEWGDKSKFYLDHVFNLFDEWVLSDPHQKVRFSPAGNKVTNWGFQTMSHGAFNFLAQLFLNLRTKSISTDLIKNHLTPRGLAYWFMDDGGRLDYNKNSKNKGVVLNTQSFKDKEVEIMAQQLMEKFNLDCEVRSNKGKKVIVIKSCSYPKFLLLIDPYILTNMRYKLP